MIKLADTVEGMNSEDYKECFKAEYDQLKIRYVGLMDMCRKWDKNELTFVPPCRRNTYELQLKAMGDYLAILEMRASMEKIDLDTNMPFSEKTEIPSIDKNRILMICDGVKTAPDTLQGGYTVRELQMYRTACDRIAIEVENLSKESEDTPEPLNVKISQEKCPIIEGSDKEAQAEADNRTVGAAILKQMLHFSNGIIPY